MAVFSFKHGPTLLYKGKILCIPWNSWKGEQILLVCMLGFLCCTEEDSFACLELFSSSPCFAVLQAQKLHHVQDRYSKSEAESRDEGCVIVSEMNSEQEELSLQQCKTSEWYTLRGTNQLAQWCFWWSVYTAFQKNKLPGL